MKIDAIGLICPEPIMLLHKAIHESKSGDIVELIATDPVAKKDVEKFCEFLDHQLVSCLLYTSPSPRDRQKSRMPSSA